MTHKFVVQITAFLLVLISTPLLGLDAPHDTGTVETIETRSIVFISRCLGGIYVNLSLWIGNVHVGLQGYFCEATVQAYIHYMVGYLMNQGYSFIGSVKEIVKGYGYGKPTHLGAQLPNLDGWPLFLIKGGHCWAAARRAAYILGLYNISSITVVLNTDPPHTILLVDPVFPGQKIVFNDREYTVLINEPQMLLPRDITQLVKYAYK